MDNNKNDTYSDSFSTLIDLIPDSVIILDVTGKIIAANKMAGVYTGFESKELVGKHFSEFIDKNQASSLAENIKKRLEGVQLLPYEIALTSKNGDARLLEVKGNRVQHAGQLLDLVIFHDITERSRQQQELQKTLLESERKFIDLAEQSADMIFLFQKGRVVYVNEECSRSLGYTKEYFYSPEFNFLNLMLPQYRQTAQENLANHLSGRDSGPYFCKEITKDGRIIDVVIKTNLIEYHGQQAILGTVTDITESKLMQQTVEDGEEKFRGITNSVRDAIILVDDEAKVTYWNPAAEKTFGYVRTEVIGKKIHELVVPPSMSKEGRAYIYYGEQAFAQTGTGTSENVELIGLRKDGTEFPAKLSISPIKLGGKWNAVGVVKDITQRKQEEQKLREAEQRYHALFNQAPIGILIVDPETAKFVEFNDVACKQLGYSREEFANLTIPQIEAKETFQEVKSHIAQMVRKGGGEFETKHRTKDGEIRNVLVSTIAVELEGKKILHCVFHDITDIRRVQNALMESETQYRQLVELAQEGIWALNNDYVTIFVNPRMADMLGYSPSSMVGKSLFDFIDHSSVDIVKNYLTNNKEISGHYQFEFLKKNGTNIFVSIAASPIKNDEGNKIGNLALVADITEQENLKRKLEEYSRNLEDLVKERTNQLDEAQAKLLKSERLAAIGELAGMVGHDLRNPLSGIKNAVYYLKKKGTNIPKTQAETILQTIDNCVERSNKIINDLLDYSRDFHLELQETSPTKLLAGALATVKVPKNVEVLTNFSDQPQISVDPEKMERVFINLIKNATDAMPRGGKLAINVEQVNGNMLLYFADTGIGISDDILPKLFSPLVTTKAQGMGFGLAICKRMVEAHGGTIHVETTKGKGTTFTIILPLNTKSKI